MEDQCGSKHRRVILGRAFSANFGDSRSDDERLFIIAIVGDLVQQR